MGNFLIVIGLIGTLGAAWAFRYGPITALRLYRTDQAWKLLGGSAVALAVGSGLLFWPATPSPLVDTASRDDPGDIEERVSQYLEQFATVAAASVTSIFATGDLVTVSTSFPASAESLPQAQLICDIARRVVDKVTVRGTNGADLWLCDQISSSPSPSMSALAGEITEPSTTTTSTTAAAARASGTGPRSGALTAAGATTTTVSQGRTKPATTTTTKPPLRIGGGGSNSNFYPLTGNAVSSGAPCSDEGDIGFTATGKRMRCSTTNSEDRLRWRAA
ncbi:MAG: hypothetical protein ACT4OM_07145 [Actinomycetota bacterium]